MSCSRVTESTWDSPARRLDSLLEFFVGPVKRQDGMVFLGGVDRPHLVYSDSQNLGARKVVLH